MNDAYIAGLFDGEGCVFVGMRQNMLDLRLKMSNTHLPALEKVRDVCSGRISKQTEGVSKSVYTWTVGGVDSEEFAKRILPYSIIKKEQLEYFLWMRENLLRKSPSPRELTSDQVIARQEAVAHLRALR